MDYSQPNPLDSISLDDYQTPLDSIDLNDPFKESKRKPTGTLDAYGQTITQAVKQVPGYIAASLEGSTPYDSNNLLDSVQATAKKDQEAFANGKDAQDPSFGGLATVQDIKQTAPSLAGSITGMVPTLAGAFTGARVGALAGSIGGIPGAVIGGTAGGIVGAGLGLFGMMRSAENQFVKENIDKENSNRAAQGQAPLTQQESVQLQNDLNATGDTRKMGMAEAFPETVGNLLETAVLATPIGKFGKSLSTLGHPLAKALTAGLMKGAATVATEAGEEEITRQLQNPIMQRHGFPEQTAGETLKQTAIATAPFAALGFGTGAYQSTKKPAEPVDTSNQQRTNINPDPNPDLRTDEQKAQDDTDLVNHANDRLATLNRKAEGTKDQIVTDPSTGKQVKIKGEWSRILSYDEMKEREYLIQHANNPAKLARFYTKNTAVDPVNNNDNTDNSIIDSTAIDTTGLQGTPNPADAAPLTQAENINGSQESTSETQNASAQEEGLLGTDALEQSGATPNLDTLAEQLHIAIATDTSKQPDQHYAEIVDDNKLDRQQANDLITKYQELADQQQRQDEQANQQTETQAQDQTSADQSTGLDFQPTHTLEDGTPVVSNGIGEGFWNDKEGNGHLSFDAKPFGNVDTATTATSTEGQGNNTGPDVPSYATTPLLNKRTNTPFTTQKLAEAAIASSSNPTVNPQDHIAVPVDGGFGIVPKPNALPGNNDTTTETQSVLSNTLANATGVTAPTSTDVAGQASTPAAQEVKQPWEMTDREYGQHKDKEHEARRLENLAKVNADLDTLTNKSEGYDALMAKETAKVAHTITPEGKFSHNLRSGSRVYNSAHDFVHTQLYKRWKNTESHSGKFRSSFANDDLTHLQAIQKAIDTGKTIPQNVLDSLNQNAEKLKYPSVQESATSNTAPATKDSKKLGLAITRAAKIENRVIDDMPGSYNQGSEHHGIDIHSINQVKDANGNTDYIVDVSNHTRVASNGHKTVDGKYSLNQLLSSGAISQKTHDFFVSEHDQATNASPETSNDHELTAQQYVDRENKSFPDNKKINDTLRKSHYTAIRSHLDQGGKISQEVFDSLDGLRRTNLKNNYGEGVVKSPAQETANPSHDTTDVSKKSDLATASEEFKAALSDVGVALSDKTSFNAVPSEVDLQKAVRRLVAAAFKLGYIKLSDNVNHVIAQLKAKFGKAAAHIDEQYISKIFNEVKGDLEGKNAVTGDLTRVNKDVRDAVNEFLSRRSSEEQTRIKDNLAAHTGTAWAAAAVKGMAYREMLHRAMEGRSIDNLTTNDIWGDQNMANTKIIKAFKQYTKFGDKTIHSLINQYDFIGGNRKAENDVSTSFANCNPSDECAVHCYAAGSNARPNEIAKSEFTEFVLENYLKQATDRIANVYKFKEAGLAGLSLRLNDKGDLSEAQLKLISGLNDKSIVLQIFSKRPDLLRKIPDANLKMLSIDSSNMEVANENPDLRLAVVITDGMTEAMLEPLHDRVSVYLPVNLKGKSVPTEELKSRFPNLYPKMKRDNLCPVDGGNMATLPGTSFVDIQNGINKGAKEKVWTCTACDLYGAAGCFKGDRQTTQRNAATQSQNIQLSDVKKELAIKNAKIELQKQLDLLTKLGEINGKQHEEISGILSTGQSDIRIDANSGTETGSGKREGTTISGYEESGGRTGRDDRGRGEAGRTSRESKEVKFSKSSSNNRYLEQSTSNPDNNDYYANGKHPNSRLNISHEDVVKRIKEMEKRAEVMKALNDNINEKIKNKTVTDKEIKELRDKQNQLSNDYKELGDWLMPAENYKSLPPIATPEQAINALDENKKELYGIPMEDIEDGTPIQLRLDIPAYLGKGGKPWAWVVTVHQLGKKLEEILKGSSIRNHEFTDNNFTAGDRIGYESVASAYDVAFGVHQKSAVNISAGNDKGTIATIIGKWKAITPEEAKERGQKALKSSLTGEKFEGGKWTQIGMNPLKHAYFYDRDGKKGNPPITHAEEIIQIGGLILAKNVVIGKHSDFLFSKSTTPVVNPHSKTTLNQAVTKAMDTLFGQGWTNRLMATGKFKMISAAEATGIIGKNAMFHKVWHGSPHDHNKFDSEHIGNGEGAQAYGWGLYFSGSQQVAEWYRDKLSGNLLSAQSYSKDGKTISGMDVLKEYFKPGRIVNGYGGNDEVISFHEHDKNWGWSVVVKGVGETRQRSHSTDPEVINVNGVMDKEGWIGHVGKLYEVDLAPNQDEYLDWDKPFVMQSDKVKALLQAEMDKKYSPIGVANLPELGGRQPFGTGKALYKHIQSHFMSDEDASKYLHSLGIRGIRYKAEAGRSETTSNYVVFNDADIKIEAKYSKNGDVIAFYNPADDTTYLVHDNITKNTSDKALQGLMLHEIGVHALTLGKSNEVFKDILRRFEALKATNPKVQAAFNRVPKDTKAEDIVEEALAYYLSENPRSSLAQRIVEWFRQAVRALGKTLPVLERAKFSQWANKLTEAELIGMATSALKSAPDSLQFDNVGRNREGIKLSDKDNEAIKQYLEVEAKYFNADGSEKSGAMLAPNGERTNLTKLQWIQVRTDNFKRFYGDWEKDGIELRGMASNVEKSSHERGVYSGGTSTSRPRNSGPLVADNGEPVIFYHGTKDIIEKGFDLDHPNKKDKGWLGRGVYAYDSYGASFMHAGNKEGARSLVNVISLFMAVKHPYIADDSVKNKLKNSNQEGIQEFTQDLIDKGYDGAIMLHKELGNVIEIVSFSTNAVKSATENNGDFSESNNIKFSRSTPSNTPADNSAMRSFFAPAKGKQALGWLAGVFQRNHLIDFVAQDLPELVNYKLLSQAKDNFTNQRENKIGISYKEMMDKMDAKTMHELGRVQGMATRLVTFDPATADYNTPMTEEERAVYDAYSAMPEGAKEAYATMRKAYQDDLTEKKNALIERIKAFPADKETQAEIIRTIEKHFDQFKEGVYFPLNRDGAVIVKATNQDGELVIEHVATQAAAYKLVQEMTAQGYDNTHIIGKDAYDRDLLAGNAANEMATLAHKTISDLKEKSIQGKLTESDFNDLFSEFNQLLINTLPDSSYRKHFIHRKGTLGESTDTLRAYAKTRTSAVKMIASLTYDHQIQDVLNNADKAIKEMDKVAGSDTLAIKSIVNELKLREAALKSTEINAVSQVLTSLGFMGALGFNIGSAAVNMLQVVGVALPELVGKHGYVEATKEISAAYKLLFNPANLDKASGLDITKNPQLTAIAKQAMEYLASIGKIDLTMTHDSIAAGKDPSYSSNPLTRAFGAAAKYSGYFFHVAEAANRQVTGMAAFNLAYQKNGGDFKAAIADAVDVIDRTQFDYGQGNRARYMMSNTARVLTLFKAYALGMSYYIGRNAMLSMKGETPEVRLQARKTLVASMAMSFATAGLFGMPIGLEAFAAIGGVAAFKYKGAKFAVPGAIGGMLIFQALLAGLGADDEDELETEFRNWLTDNFDQTTAEWVTKGPARLLPIGDIAGRTSLSELWWRSQNKQLEGTDQYNAIATALIGPIGSQVAGLFTAKKMYEDGQYKRMMESMSPAFLRNAIAANRMGTEGVTNLKGDKIIQRDLTPVELINKVIGFNPTVVTNTYDANSAIAKESTKHTLAKSHLVNRWMSGDATERSDLMKGAIKDFNESVPPSERITLKSLFKSMRSRKGIDKHTQNGLYLSKKQNYLRDLGRFNRQE